MTSKADFMNQPIDPEADRRWRLARREDLASVVGIVLTVPFHGEDEAGTSRYGIRPVGGMPNMGIVDEFNAEMRKIVIESTKPLQEAGLLTTEEAEAIDGHPYESGPAAQSWPQVFFEIYQSARPILSEAATLIALAQAAWQAYRGFEVWKVRKEAQTRERAGGEVLFHPYTDLEPRPVYTLPVLVALIYKHATEQYGLVGDCEINVFPRSRFGNYASPDHPSGNESYLIRLTNKGTSFFYSLNGRCEVFDHFQMAGEHTNLLPFPDLLPVEHSSSQYLNPEAPQCFVVNTGVVERDQA